MPCLFLLTITQHQDPSPHTKKTPSYKMIAPIGNEGRGIEESYHTSGPPYSLYIYKSQQKAGHCQK